MGSPASTIPGSAAAVGLGLLVVLALGASADGAVADHLTGERFLIDALALAAYAAPLAVLVTRDEIDLSGIGVVAAGGYVYAEVDRVALGVAAAALVGGLVGAAVGLLRWSTGAHSAVVSLAAGMAALGAVGWAASGPEGRVLDAAVRDSGIAVFTSLAVVGAALGLTARSPARDRVAGGRVGPSVVAPFALSALGAAAFGALLAGRSAFFVAGGLDRVFLLAFAAVGIGGVVRASGVLAPIVAAVGAAVVLAVREVVFLNGWRDGQDEAIVGLLFGAGLLLANVLQRVLRRTT